MVLLFSDRKSKDEKEIIEILAANGGDYISDKTVSYGGGAFTFISKYKSTELRLNNGIAVFIGNTDKFKQQRFPKGIIGVCEEGNRNALELFSKSPISVICCGMNSKNTITLSSLSDDTVLTTVQRTIITDNGTEIEPCEFLIKLTKSYSPFAIMASTAALLLCGIIPNKY
ncbi:MAG: hypothetical protein IKD04_05705 [Clostridia bacterium]|nr:hypothetical protein [Clostridia bacterium]